MVSRECPTGCGRPIDPSRRLMCDTCWSRVPTPLRDAVTGAWKAWKDNRATHGLMLAYDRAATAAIKAAQARTP